MPTESLSHYYRFVMSPLGEPVRCTDPEEKDAQLPGGGTINVGSVAQSVLAPEDYDVYSGFDGKSSRWKAINRYVRECVRHQFHVDAYEDLSLAEYDFYCRISRLQRLNDGRFRIWGEMHADNFDGDRRKAWLVTEFIWWIDDEAYWRRLDALAKECGCEIHVMSEDEHVDKYWPAEVASSGAELTDANAVIGENHGRMERQVEFRCNVYGQSLAAVRKRIAELAARTADVWRQSGVCVG